MAFTGCMVAELSAIARKRDGVIPMPICSGRFSVKSAVSSSVKGQAICEVLLLLMRIKILSNDLKRERAPKVGSPLLLLVE